MTPALVQLVEARACHQRHRQAGRYCSHPRHKRIRKLDQQGWALLGALRLIERHGLRYVSSDTLAMVKAQVRRTARYALKTFPELRGDQ